MKKERRGRGQDPGLCRTLTPSGGNTEAQRRPYRASPQAESRGMDMRALCHGAFINLQGSPRAKTVLAPTSLFEDCGSLPGPGQNPHPLFEGAQPLHESERIDS